MKLLPLEKEIGDDAENDERNDFLNNFQLHQREGTAIASKADTVCRYLTTIFEEGYCPREHDDTN